VSATHIPLLIFLAVVIGILSATVLFRFFRWVDRADLDAAQRESEWLREEL
jgi:type II secretory pathway pseudopilin PulG